MENKILGLIQNTTQMTISFSERKIKSIRTLILNTRKNSYIVFQCFLTRSQIKTKEFCQLVFTGASPNGQDVFCCQETCWCFGTAIEQKTYKICRNFYTKTKTVLEYLRIDNKIAVEYINRGQNNQHMKRITQQIWDRFEKRNIAVYTRHVPLIGK